MEKHFSLHCVFFLVKVTIYHLGTNQFKEIHQAEINQMEPLVHKWQMKRLLHCLSLLYKPLFVKSQLVNYNPFLYHILLHFVLVKNTFAQTPRKADWHHYINRHWQEKERKKKKENTTFILYKCWGHEDKSYPQMNHNTVRYKQKQKQMFNVNGTSTTQKWNAVLLSGQDVEVEIYFLSMR